MALVAAFSAVPAVAGPGLRVGAAKIDLTPPAESVSPQFRGVLDPLFARAIVIDSGGKRAALVSVDAGALGSETWAYVSGRAERELGIPAAQLMLTATHTHSAPFVRDRAFEDGIVAAIAQAAAALRPARMAWGTGQSYINVNRNMIDPVTGRWWEGANYQGVSDKTVAVLTFESLSGSPIAVYYNYGVHPVITGNLDLVSADIPGATSTYIEESLGGGAVAAWSSGAAGDQNPIYFQQTYDLRQIRIDDYAKRGQDIANAMPPGGQGMDRSNPRVALLMEQQKRMVLSMGQLLGEEVLHTSRFASERPIEDAAIDGGQTLLRCPGRARTDTGRAGYPGTYADAGEVTLRLSLLRIGDTVIGGVDGEVFTAIAQRFKRQSPFKHTMMATLTNGMAQSGYIPSDEAAGYNTFEVLSSRLKPGCAERGIVNGLADLVGTVNEGAGR
ncbi:MAG: neutral/alkaline non-lysosomal ceramidase N-terminal domain-containing protein [Candidatus Andeanibacterium colombiense]|uniref:Neutral/alkaline non-lysosomal ceramidase N-terminal domain-containing protein n=1 Tax=Candidatus Andeanibacterium colombiense TaxID=3121345 RepID=A0AAJ5XA65_9SPHN|nr:MAG: neutral/alkaline non-lysosomal ceramidase N-terminal domain-containing protein [Sphingomonadaceae bacterium]